MAISAPTYQLLKSLKAELPHGGKLLEIGEANWYGDVEPDFLIEPSAIMCQGRHLETVRKVLESSKPDSFAICKAFYRQLFAPSITHAVDMGGTPSAIRQDLNRPLSLANKYDVVINHGTAEHVFNIAQVFKSMHDATVPGGLMIHDSPCTGWVDHGFYCLQPTLFYDLAAANGYNLRLLAFYQIAERRYRIVETREHLHAMVKEGLPDNSCLFVAMRKQKSDQFKIPMQGYYAQTLSESGVKAWEEVR